AAKPDTGGHAHPAAPSDKPMMDTAAAHAHAAPSGVRPEAAAPRHDHADPVRPAVAAPARPGSARAPTQESSATAPDTSRGEVGGPGTSESGAGGLPMHSGHPLVVHFPLVALLLAVLLDTVAVVRLSTGWRSAATLLWWVGLVGAAAAIGTGLLAFARVDHSDPAHAAMSTHRNLALAAVAVLLVSAAWRWRRPLSRGAAAMGILGALGLSAAAYLGGEMVYRHALGIPTAVLKQVSGERVGFDEDTMKPVSGAQDTLTADPIRKAGTPPNQPHTHAPGKQHDD
ncbi:MAG TPA: DUF2231 domain-containing protein, partial [Gemmatimonadales bacterium]|nr:DUF2231 domain-containing protein [Gemmatimonadales bacterium]